MDLVLNNLQMLICNKTQPTNQTKHSVHIMVFGIIISNGDIMHLFFFPHRFTLNTEVYSKCLVEVVLPWIKWVAAGRAYAWQ